MSADAVIRPPVRQSPYLKLAVLALGFAAMALNWFDMPAAFPGIHWFRGTRGHAFAMGVVSASFALGVTIGLSVWVAVVEATTWRVALVIAGGTAVAVGIAIVSVYRIPPNAAALRGGPLTLDEVRRVLRSRVLWRYGLAFFGGYGAYFTATQLLRVYATSIHRSSGSITVAVVLIGVAGIPGSTLAGWLSDRAGSRRPFVVGFLLIQALGLVLIPVSGGFLWLPAVIVGFGFNGCFAVFQSTAAEDPDVSIEHIGTAIGLMLTIAAVGGFIVPAVFGRLSVSAGYTAAGSSPPWCAARSPCWPPRERRRWPRGSRPRPSSPTDWSS